MIGLEVLYVTLQDCTWNMPVRIPAGLSDIPTVNVWGFIQYFLFAVTIYLNTPLCLPSRLLGQSRNYSCA